MVITAYSDQCYDLREIAVINKARYGPVIFPSASCRFKFPFLTQSIFESGKFVFTGTVNHTDTLYAAYLSIYNIFKKTGRHTSLFNFRLVNVVGSLALGYRVDLDSFAAAHQWTSIFDPDKFPGVRWMPLSKKKGRLNICFIIYESGSIVITGARTDEQLAENCEKYVKDIERFKYGECGSLTVPAVRSSYRVSMQRMQEIEDEERMKSHKRSKKQIPHAKRKKVAESL